MVVEHVSILAWKMLSEEFNAPRTDCFLIRCILYSYGTFHLARKHLATTDFFASPSLKSSPAIHRLLFEMKNFPAPPAPPSRAQRFRLMSGPGG